MTHHPAPASRSLVDLDKVCVGEVNSRDQLRRELICQCMPNGVLADVFGHAQTHGQRTQ